MRIKRIWKSIKSIFKKPQQNTNKNKEEISNLIQHYNQDIELKDNYTILGGEFWIPNRNNNNNNNK